MRLRIPAILLAGTLVLAACGNDDNGNGDGDNGEPETQDEAAPQDAPELDDLEGLDDPQAEDLPDPNEMVSDGVFSGQGMVLPAPDGWQFNEMMFAQGIVSAQDEGASQELAGQVLELDMVPEQEELSLESVVEANRSTFPEEPAVDESIEVADGEGYHMRYEGLPAQVEGAPEMTVALLVIEGDGQVGVFNYAAEVDVYDDDVEQLLLDTAGFDPDSDPMPPPEPEPLPEGEPGDIPEELEDLEDLDLEDLEAELEAPEGEAPDSETSDEGENPDDE